jgi:hypothetical protein
MVEKLSEQLNRQKLSVQHPRAVGAFARTFQLVSEPAIQTYRWVKSRWQTPHEVLIRQNISGGEVTVTNEQPQEVAPLYPLQYKAYIVWKSGGKPGDSDSNKIRREVNIFFWLDPDEGLLENRVRGWLNTACETALGVSLSECETWHDGHYSVEAASMGIGQQLISDYEKNMVRWTYLKDKRQIRSPGMFPK